MEAIKKLSFLILISISILLQSYVVYDKSEVALIDAAMAKVRTKVVTEYGQTMKFKYIIFEGEEYYGVQKVSGKLVRTKLNKADLKAVYIQDKPTSIMRSFSPLIILLAGLQ